ncbi:hypothetical protein QYM36_016588 [Artemia franciscana]|uniref:Uncharacterized protein n=1 Tax=Artemia franciscana TaxID=6661 RepID=A0AA88HAA4_ARTSF|nr:hypothetical protein QYM36_016588 [Artemia franciscana]
MADRKQAWYKTSEIQDVFLTVSEIDNDPKDLAELDHAALYSIMHVPGLMSFLRNTKKKVWHQQLPERRMMSATSAQRRNRR